MLSTVVVGCVVFTGIHVVVFAAATVLGTLPGDFKYALHKAVRLSSSVLIDLLSSAISFVPPRKVVLPPRLLSKWCGWERKVCHTIYQSV